jgi:hypothetical protein
MRGKKKKIQKVFHYVNIEYVCSGFSWGPPPETTGYQKGVQDLAAASTERRLAD